MNVYPQKFTKSTDLNRQPNSCVAWKVHSQFTFDERVFRFCQTRFFFFSFWAFFLRRTLTNATWSISLLAPDYSPKQMLTAAPWFTSGQRWPTYEGMKLPKLRDFKKWSCKHFICLFRFLEQLPSQSSPGQAFCTHLNRRSAPSSSRLSSNFLVHSEVSTTIS